MEKNKQLTNSKVKNSQAVKTLNKSGINRAVPKKAKKSNITGAIIISLSLVSVIYLISLLFSQKASFSGQIVDTLNNPLTETYIKVDNEQAIKNTNVSAKFVINELSSGEHTVIFSREGFKDRIEKLNLKNKQKLEKVIVLQPDSLNTADNNQKAIVVNSGSNSVSVLDMEENKEIKKVLVGNQPKSLVVTNNKIFIANFGDSTVSVIDGNSLLQTKKIKLESGSGPSKVLSSIGGDKVYVLNGSRKNISIIDSETDKVLKEINLTSSAKDMFIDQSNGNLILLYFNEVGVISDSGTVFSTVQIPNTNSVKGEFVSAINTLFLLSGTNIKKVNLVTGAIDTFKLGFSPTSITVNEFTGSIYISSSNSVNVFDYNSGSLIKENIFSGGSMINSLNLNADGSLLYISHSSSGDISVLNTATNELEYSGIQVGNQPIGTAFL